MIMKLNYNQMHAIAVSGASKKDCMAKMQVT